MIEVKVPATSANVGPGFDCLGIALNLYNRIRFEEIESGYEFEGCEDQFKNEDNLVVKSIKYFIDYVKPAKVPGGFKIIFDADIPVCRGLGSSAACIVAGVYAADYFTDSNLSKEELLKIATDIEGHPDNIAPAIFGNMTVSILHENGDIIVDQIDISDKIQFCPMIPNFRLSTEKSRGVLPKQLDYKDAVFNVSRVALLIAALSNNRFEFLKAACEDKLHQNYRGSLIEGFDKVVDASYSNGALGVFLSGAGPTIMALNNVDNADFDEKMTPVFDTLEADWTLLKLKCEKNGASIKVID